MLRDNRFQLITLGRLTLVGTGGEEDASLARRRLKLAVLAVLALTRRPIPRDTLLGLFWAEHDENRARHSLSNALSSLRGALGERSITTRDADVSLDSDTPLDVDALEFVEAIEGRDFARAVELYQGPFLEGFHVDDSPAFEQWVSRERRRLETMFVKACEEHCASLARSRRWPECGKVAERWFEAEPLSADAAIYFLNAIKAPGTRAALAEALEEFEALRTRLNKEFELAPHPSVMELATRIREQLAAAPPEPVVNLRVTAETKAAVSPTTPPHREATEAPAPVAVAPAATKKPRSLLAVGLLAAGAVVVALLAYQGRAIVARQKAGNTAARPIIAVLPVPMRSVDSTSAWLSEGLPQMIDGKLSNIAALEVIPSAQVRAVVRRSGRATDAEYSDAEARDLARRVGATLVVQGALGRDAGSYVLDLAVRDVRTGTLVRNAILTHADPLMLADQAAARILTAANVSSQGPRFNVETSSLEAYQHFMRAQEAASAGRLPTVNREYEAALAADSGFIPALRARLGWAVSANDTLLIRTTRERIEQNLHRASEFDRAEQELWDAYNGGEHERSEALARGLMRRFPRDARSYNMALAIFMTHGKFDEAEPVAIAAMALDSLSISAGSGPCAQCVGFYNVIALRWLRQDWKGADAWARRWIAVQPDAPAGWTNLAWNHFYAGRPDSAIVVMQRALTLAGNEQWAMDQYARMLLVNRRYATADSVIQRMGMLYPGSWAEKADLELLLAREQGQLKRAEGIIDALDKRNPQTSWFVDLVRSDNRRLMGEYAAAGDGFERLGHGLRDARLPLPFSPAIARAVCWHHALAADAWAPIADTARLRAIADTLERGCTRSYYGRDARMYHHVRGLLAMRQQRYADAERDFHQAVWSLVEGWGRTDVELAKARLALGKPNEAIAALRPAYATRLDAMGRYVPISELDFWMSKSFEAAGLSDSARVYSAYVEGAWKNADPEVRRQVIASVPPIKR